MKVTKQETVKAVRLETEVKPGVVRMVTIMRAALAGDMLALYVVITEDPYRPHELKTAFMTLQEVRTHYGDAASAMVYEKLSK